MEGPDLLCLFFLLFGFTICQICIIAIYNINQNMKYYYCNSL